MKILAIETSCDETAAAVVQDGTKIISNVVASSTKMHEKYGGIVPEVAAREQLKCIIPVIQEAAPSLSEIDAIAVTVGPGLIGSLLVGVETAKTIAFVTGKPIIPVNHVIAHIYANFVDGKEISFPAISLVVSGGHTELYLMKSSKDLTWLGGTLDDAAGECFDKTARLLGFGHGGGQAIQISAQTHHASPITHHVILPRPMIHDETLNFSFSGLKTAVMREWKKYSSNPSPITHHPSLTSAFAYEIQESITDVLVEKTIRAAKQHGAKSILLSGGVAANVRLREKFSIQHSSFSIHAPESRLCTDNAVMIGAAAFWNGESSDWHKITATPDLSVEIDVGHAQSNK